MVRCDATLLIVKRTQTDVIVLIFPPSAFDYGLCSIGPVPTEPRFSRAVMGFHRPKSTCVSRALVSPSVHRVAVFVPSLVGFVAQTFA